MGCHMDQRERLEASAIIDELIADGLVFDADTAVRLIELIPLFDRPFWRVIRFFDWRSSYDFETSSITRGCAEGAGNVAVDDPRKSSGEWTGSGIPTWRVGKYKMRHYPGLMEIEQLFADTMEDFGHGRRAKLVYRANVSRPRPIVLKLCTVSDLLLPLAPGIQLGIGVPRYVPWKTPV